MKLETPISVVELEEYLFSQTAAQFAQDNSPEKTAEHMRESFRMHRFFVLTWLLQNGVAVPVELLDDRTHPPVGQQAPDRPAILPCVAAAETLDERAAREAREPQRNTTDPEDPNLGHGVDTGPVPQHKVYLVLSEEERAKGFVRPVRRKYIHSRGKAGGCGTVTTMGLALCETYARDPKFYGSTYCCGCSMHLPVADFDWIESTGSTGPAVGS